MLDSGAMGRAAVPSGASTGTREAVELRDGDTKRYLGKGVLKAVANVNGRCCAGAARAGCARPGGHRRGDDRARRHREQGRGSAPTRCSRCRSPTAHAAANDRRAAAVSGYLGRRARPVMPVPMMNIINGGAHADNSLDIQEFMILPVGAPSFREALRYGAEIFHTLKKMLHERGLATAVGDEGGFAPDLPSNEAALEIILAGHRARPATRPGRTSASAWTSAAPSSTRTGVYDLESRGPAVHRRRSSPTTWRTWRRAIPSSPSRTAWRGRLGRLGAAHPRARRARSSWSATTCS